jgi:NTE family protein
MPDPNSPESNLLNPGVGLCLSGGGYRAAVFHLGALIRLNEVGILNSIQRISSVSGGSITAAYLGLKWNELNFLNGVADNLISEVINPIRLFVGNTIDEGAILGGIFNPFRSISDEVTKAYDRLLFRSATLQDLPTDDHGPRFVINATNIQSGALWRFSRPFMGDYRVGITLNPTVSLAQAVAASSAFPPVLSPLTLDLSNCVFQPDEIATLQHSPFTDTAVLSDGGVYDNMGLETVWKAFKTVLVSDAGAAFTPEPKPASDWTRHSIRVLNVVDNQVRSLRKRELVSLYKQKSIDGAYWAISGNPTNYPQSEAIGHLGFNATRALELAATPTRLKEVEEELQENLINLGYVMATVALASHFPGKIPFAPANWPFTRGLN